MQDRTEPTEEELLLPSGPLRAAGTVTGHTSYADKLQTPLSHRTHRKKPARPADCTHAEAWCCAHMQITWGRSATRLRKEADRRRQ